MSKVDYKYIDEAIELLANEADKRIRGSSAEVFASAAIVAIACLRDLTREIRDLRLSINESKKP